jgi:membrane protease YdiL (CAAX protease family)
LPDNVERGGAPLAGVRAGAWFALVYVIIVLGVDLLAWGTVGRVPLWGGKSLALPFNFNVFQWVPATVTPGLERAGLPAWSYTWMEWRVLQRFDFFKFVFWMLAPLLVCLWRMDWGALGFRRWKRMDYWILAGLAIAGGVAVFLIPLFPELRAEFGGLGRQLAQNRWLGFLIMFFWCVSWVTGWEFLHRYFLLRRLDGAWPKYGWVLVPIIEAAYHLRSPAMAAGMALFSIVACIWVRERKNIMLPFLAHFFIEMALVAYLLFA